MFELLYLLLKTVKLPRLEHIIFKIVLLVVLGHTCVSLGQLDIPRRPITIEGLQNNAAPRSVLVSPENLTGMVSSGTLVIKSKMNLSEPLPGKEKRQARFMEGEKFAKKEYAALESKMNKKFNPIDIEKKIVLPEDYNIGVYNSNGKFAKFVFRDHGQFDNDQVKIMVNDVVVYEKITLTLNYIPVTIDLVDGFNKIDIIAINQGSLGANTAEFQIFDDSYNTLRFGQWWLATGKKATVIIVKD